MATNKLILRSEFSPYGDITKGTTLSLAELDNNLIYLKGESVLNGSLSGNTLILNKTNDNAITIDLSSISGGGGSGTDSNAIHKNVPAEISTIDAKLAIVPDDLFIIEDSADSNNKKKITSTILRTFINAGAIDSNAIHSTESNEISGITLKSAPLLGGDLFVIEDSNGSVFNKKRTTLNDIKTFINAGGSDSDAIHKNISSEIQGIDAKTAPLVATDLFVIEDSSGSTFNKKSVTLADIKTFTDAGGGATDDNAIHDNVPAEIAGIGLKSSIIGNDLFLIEDSALSNVKKRTTLNDIKNFVNSGGSDSDAIHKNIDNEFSTISSKPGVVGTDLFLIEDSDGTTFDKKKVTLTDIKNFINSGGLDTDAIHKSTPNEIVNIPEKTTTLDDNDEFVIEDSANSNNKKSVKLSLLKTFVNAGSGGGGGATGISAYPISLSNNTTITNHLAIKGIAIVPDSDITVNKMSFYIESITGSGISKIKVGIYKQSDKTRVAYGKDNSPSAGTVAGMNTINLNTSAVLSAGVEYYLVMYTNTAALNLLGRTGIAAGPTDALALGFQYVITIADSTDLPNTIVTTHNGQSPWLRAHS